MKRNRFILLASWLILCAFPALPAGGPVKTLLIAVTTDVHGAYFPDDWYTGKRISGSLSQVSAWAASRRKEPGIELVLLDNGDLIQGDPASYYSNFIDTLKPNIAARILNFMDYSAGTVGNHDLEAGHPVYDRLTREFRFPWLAANAVRTDNGDSWFRPYAILDKAGLKIAVLGLITPKVPDWLPDRLWSGMQFRDMIATARKWVEIIEREEKPDLLIGLFHSGTDPSYGQQDALQPLNENASRLVAEQVPGFDAVFTGHDHRNWNLRVAGPTGDSVLILGSESRAEEFAVAAFPVTRVKGRAIAGRPVGAHVRTANMEPDPAFTDKFAGYADSLRSWIDQPVGTLAAAISSDGAWTGPDPFTGLIHRVQLELTGARISFTAPLSFRTQLPEGPVTVKDLFRLYRFENQLYTMELTGSEILAYLNYSYGLWMKQMNGPGDRMLNIRQQPDGSWRFANAYYNFDSAAGIDYTVDLSKPAGGMVTIRQFTDGRPFDPAATYTVALNSYRASGGGGHLLRGAGLTREAAAGRIIRATDRDFRFLMSEWFRDRGPVTPVCPANWRTVPEAWTTESSVRDLELLRR